MNHTYTIDDLLDRSILDEGAEKPARLAVIGAPVKHSASPQMHQAALDAQEQEVRYVRVHVEPGSVKEALTRMEKLGFIGVNVTVPHKLEVMEVCDTLTESAQQLGAVNTVHFTEKGWLGHNTDGPGLANALSDELGQSFSNSNTLIIGAGGGAGRAIAIQAALDKCPKLTLSNRTISKLDDIATKIKQLNPVCDLTLIDNSFDALSSVTADLVINATSLGMKESDALPFPAKAIQPAQVYYDAVYSPPQTEMLKAFANQGCRTANGQSMLVHQGALSYQMWLNEKPNLTLMAKAIQ